MLVEFMNIQRYRRQTLVKEFGVKGQEMLSTKHVVIIGGGGLGSHSSEILVRLGVGSVEIIDDDPVDETNLHRTSIFTEDDIGKIKSLILEERLHHINSRVTIKGVQQKATKDTIASLIKNADVILDGTDNMETRFLINEASVKYDTPWIYAGVHATMGMVMGIIPRQTPCFTCLSQNIPDTPGETPVLGHLPLSIASIQCTETIKLLLGKQLDGLIIYDVWKQSLERLDVQRNQDCLCCCKKIFTFL